MKFVDISGFGNSGKTVVTDFLRQYDTVFSFPNHVEFELFRVPGGLLDLYFSIYESWNLIRSSVRIEEFKYLVNRIGTIQTIKNPLSYFTASGHGYNQHFNNRFIELSNQLINKIVTGEQYTYWPYKILRASPPSVFYNKFKSKFFNELISDKIYFSNRADFIDYVQEYMQSLFAEAVSDNHTHVLLNNAFDPFYPTLCINMIGDACAIIVDRDPRDIFASQINDSDKFIPEFEKKKNIEKIKKQIIAFDDINQFIVKYKTIKSNINYTDENKVLRVRYEDFILDHQNQAQLVNDFVGLNSTATISKNDFNINNSLKNVGIWKKYEHLPQIQTIFKELKPYCYQS